MNNILNYRQNKKITFIAFNVWITLPYSDKTVEKKRMALIGIDDQINELTLIHPLSEFILDNWKFHKFNTQRKHAGNLVKFLNYLKEEKLLDNLVDIEVRHCTVYLNSVVSEGNKDDTVKGIQSTLSTFLIWLLDRKFVSNESLKNFKRRYCNNKINNTNIFNVAFSGVNINNNEHTLPLEYIPLFIEVAIKYANPIALGIYFQFFGGLRVSEVVNLNRTQISRRVSKGDFIVNIKSQNYRTDLQEHSSAKKNRLQEVLNINNMGSELFNNHINTYQSSDGTSALFVNRDGKAMSVGSYRRYFETVKKEFISLLEDSTDLDMRMLGISLKHSKWSTHIGRGTFTHMIAEHSNNPIEIAHNRGDSNLDSAIPYFANTNRIYESLRESFNYMHNEYIEKLIKRIDDDE